jgi:hypothetical protein
MGEPIAAAWALRMYPARPICIAGVWIAVGRMLRVGMVWFGVS